MRCSPRRDEVHLASGIWSSLGRPAQQPAQPGQPPVAQPCQPHEVQHKANAEPEPRVVKPPKNPRKASRLKTQNAEPGAWPEPPGQEH
eukprot:2331444-Pyramimonas_sp.AAC.1